MSNPNITVLCFDFGTQHIGVAVGQSITQTASPLTTLKAKDGIPNWDELQLLIHEWQPNLLVVGKPFNMDGSESELSQRATKFGNRLNGRFNIEVEMVDERLSSFEAKGEIIEKTGSRDFKQHDVDGIAAKLILESWFQGQANSH